MLRMGDATAVAVRSLPFRIGAGEDADMVWGGMSCKIDRAGGGCEMLTVGGVGAMVNGDAMFNEHEPWALFNGYVVAMAGLQFVVEDIRVIGMYPQDVSRSTQTSASALPPLEVSASALPPQSERGVTGSGQAGSFHALEQAMEKALECIICHETVLSAPSEPQPVLPPSRVCLGMG